MIKSFTFNSINFFISGFFAIISTWILLGATPYLRLGGMFIQVETQIIYLHSLCATMMLYKIFENVILIKKKKNIVTDNLLTLLPLGLAISSLSFSFLKGSFYKDLLGTPQLGQGTLWYFDLYVMILVFSSFLIHRRARIIMLINLVILTTIATVFTIKPFFMGLNVSFYNFTDYLCFYGALCFIIFTSLTRNKILLIAGYIVLGLYLLPLKNNSAYFLWIITFFAVFIYYLLDQIKFDVVNNLKNFFYSNLALTAYIFAASTLILLSSIIFWSGEYGIPEKITKSAFSSLVVRGKIAEISLLSMFDLKNFFLGNGWGEVPHILLANMSAWHYDQLTLGYNLHFHTHNELFEHLVSSGIIGFLLFVFLIFYIFKYSESKEIFTRLSWFFFFTLTCFWFIFSGTLPLIAAAIACLCEKATFNKPKNLYYEKVVEFKRKFENLLHVGIFFLMIIGVKATYDTIKMHDKLSQEKLLEYVKTYKANNNQKEEYHCKNYFKDFDRGGYMIPPMINNYTNYLIKIEKNEINDNSAAILKLLFCIAEEIIASDKASLDLISSVMQAESRLYFSEYESLKELIYSKKDISLWMNRVNKIAELAPKRGDLLIPSMAYFIENGNSEEVMKLCKNKKVEGIKSYCELVFAFDILKEDTLSQIQLNVALEHLQNAVEEGILKEKIYGWWDNTFKIGKLQGYSKEGIPLSPDFLFHVSHDEAINILKILSDYKATR